MNIAYHWKRNTTPILCMATGIALTASLMSVTAWWSPLGADRISARSSSEGVSSLVRDIAVHRQQDAEGADEEADVHPVGHAVAGGLLQRRHLLQEEQRQVRQHRAGPGEDR